VTRPRLRDLGVPLTTLDALPPGPLNAITDVPGIRVGHTTLISGTGPLLIGKGPIRTGATAIHPHSSSAFTSSVPCAIRILNGTGEITGRSHVDELGLLESPILLTTTLSVGEAHRGLTDWLCRHNPTIGPRHFVVPVVAETFDGWLNDAAGQHVTKEHTIAALDSATTGHVPEGNVGGGTGMRLFGFKGGIGTSSRMVQLGDHPYTVGTLVQGNFGSRDELLVDGVPVGRALRDWEPPPAPESGERAGSVIVVIATDAPLNERQLGRLCRRGMLGLGRVGATAGNTSGDLLVAFSNGPENRVDRFDDSPLRRHTHLADGVLGPVFRATVDATAEAVLNALCAAETMTGRDGHTAHALPLDRVADLLRTRAI
jgi:D-aminopeptidase